MHYLYYTDQEYKILNISRITKWSNVRIKLHGLIFHEDNFSSQIRFKIKIVF